jgi:hypothetical protein
MKKRIRVSQLKKLSGRFMLLVKPVNFFSKVKGITNSFIFEIPLSNIVEELERKKIKTVLCELNRESEFDYSIIYI